MCIPCDQRRRAASFCLGVLLNVQMLRPGLRRAARATLETLDHVHCDHVCLSDQQRF